MHEVYSGNFDQYTYLLILFYFIFTRLITGPPPRRNDKIDGNIDRRGKGGCGKPHWKGDKICDDENNNAGCDFDGGDCCGDDVETHYCKKCECLEEKEKAPDAGK